MPVDDIMRRWPQTISVMIRYRMLCVGCPIGAFHTIQDACREHGVPEDVFIRDLEMAIAG
jgi:hybrid cluster-associated redox disulfide protein